MSEFIMGATILLGIVLGLGVLFVIGKIIYSVVKEYLEYNDVKKRKYHLKIVGIVFVCIIVFIFLAKGIGGCVVEKSGDYRYGDRYLEITKGKNKKEIKKIEKEKSFDDYWK